MLLQRADGISKLVRLEADGSGFDPTFVPPADVSASSNPWVMGLQAAGDKIVLARRSSPTDASVVVLRLTVDGALDAGFPSTGTLGDPGLFATPAAVAAQADGSVIVGTTVEGVGGRLIKFAKFLNNGPQDGAYGGGDGFATVPFSGQATLQAMTLLPDNSLVAVGKSAEGTLLFPAYMRLNAAGVVVAGSLGTFTVDIGASQGFSNRPVGIVATSDGTKVITGMLIRDPGRTSFFAALALRLDATEQGAGYVLDSNGAFRSMRPAGGAPPACVFDNPKSTATTYRGIALARDRGGVVVDRSGGLHRFTAGVLKLLPAPHGGPSWPGQDIARGVALRPGLGGGYVVDLFGFLHPFRVGGNAAPPAARGAPGFTFDAARGVALMPDGKSGYVVDLFGGLHRFAVGSSALPPLPHGGPTFPFDAARGVSILPDGSGGFVVDLVGVLHPFRIGASPGPSVTPVAKLTPGQDRARGLAFLSTTGMTSSSLGAAAAAGSGVSAEATDVPRRYIPPPTP